MVSSILRFSHLAPRIACLAFLGGIATASQSIAAPNVVTTIAPIHSITQAIMGDSGKATLLVPQNASPHSTDFRPSQAQALQQADMVIWVGPNIETFLIDPLKTLATKATVLELFSAKGISHLPLRTGTEWEKHNHDDDHSDEHDHEKEEHHDEKDHEKHASHDDHADDKDHKHEEEHDDHEKHDDHDKHADSTKMDNHIWLDPKNGIAMAEAIAAALSAQDKDNAALYQKNKKALIKDLNTVLEEGQTELASVKDRPFLVFHDAYQYLEARFGLKATGSIMLQPGITPGAARVKQVREKLTNAKAVCLFTEPQFSDKIVPVLVEGSPAKLGKLDPIGMAQEAGPTLYPNLIRANIKALKACLSAS